MVGVTDRITLHLPEELPDGTAVDSGIFAEYEQALLGICAGANDIGSDEGEIGFTVIGKTSGAWRSPGGQLVREPMRLYLLDVPEADLVLDEIRQLAERTQAQLEQQAIYVTVAPIRVFVIDRLLRV